MRRQSQSPRALTEQTVKLPTHEQVNEDTRRLFVELADRLPGGRKSLGTYALRANQAAVGRYTPRLGDLVIAAEAGAPVAPILALLDEVAARVKEAAPAQDETVCAATLARETGEALAATFTALQHPSNENDRAALRELKEARTVLDRVCGILAPRRHQRAQARWSALSTLRGA